jgi:hypothetical protein
MNYQQIYDNLINTAQLRIDTDWLNGYTENHHILPKSMGGSNDCSNIVKLTAREHFIAHWILWKIHKNKEMSFAFNMMSSKGRNGNRYYNSRGYMIAKQSTKGLKFSHEHKEKMKQAHTGIAHSESRKLKIKNTLTGRKLSVEHRLKIGKARIGVKRKPFTAEHKANISSGKIRAALNKAAHYHNACTGNTSTDNGRSLSGSN